jgi:hypothetical protein
MVVATMVWRRRADDEGWLLGMLMSLQWVLFEDVVGRRYALDRAGC